MSTEDQPRQPTAALQRLVSTCHTVCAGSSGLPGVDIVHAAFPTAKTALIDQPGCLDGVADLMASTEGLIGPQVDLDFAEAAREAAEELRWLRAYSHYDEPDLRRLQTTYAVAPIIGADGDGDAPLSSDQIRVYLTIQQSGVVYPSHAHKAAELYHIVVGRSLWSKGRHPFAFQEAGAWIHHPTGTRHAMETITEPMLALAIWSDSFDDPPVIIRS